MDRQGDYSGARWRGKVVNVMDPAKQGRFQVRVFNMHDDEALVPDKDLPWALVRVPINAGASVRGVGASPVGVIPGSIVDGYFGDAERTILIATGTLMSAGKTKTGATTDGSSTLDDKYNDVADAARGKDVNAALGLKNLPEISSTGAAYSDMSSGVGTSSESNVNILSILRQVDPGNRSGSLVNSVDNLLKLQGIGQLGSLSGFPGGLSGGLAAVSQAISTIQSTKAKVQSTISTAQTTIKTIKSTPEQLQSLAKSQAQSLISRYGSVNGALSLVNSLSNLNASSLSNPLSLAAGFPVIGNILQIAMSILGGNIRQVLTDFMSSMKVTNQLRELALKASDPNGLIEQAFYSDTPGDITSTELPPVITSREVLDSVLGDSNTTNDAVGPVEEVDTTAENLNIMNQIQKQVG